MLYYVVYISQVSTQKTNQLIWQKNILVFTSSFSSMLNVTNFPDTKLFNMFMYYFSSTNKCDFIVRKYFCGYMYNIIGFFLKTFYNVKVL